MPPGRAAVHGHGPGDGGLAKRDARRAGAGLCDEASPDPAPAPAPAPGRHTGHQPPATACPADEPLLRLPPPPPMDTPPAQPSPRAQGPSSPSAARCCAAARSARSVRSSASCRCRSAELRAASARRASQLATTFCSSSCVCACMRAVRSGAVQCGAEEGREGRVVPAAALALAAGVGVGWLLRRGGRAQQRRRVAWRVIMNRGCSRLGFSRSNALLPLLMGFLRNISARTRFWSTRSSTYARRGCTPIPRTAGRPAQPSAAAPPPPHTHPTHARARTQTHPPCARGAPPPPRSPSWPPRPAPPRAAPPAASAPPPAPKPAPPSPRPPCAAPRQAAPGAATARPAVWCGAAVR